MSTRSRPWPKHEPYRPDFIVRDSAQLDDLVEQAQAGNQTAQLVVEQHTAACLVMDDLGVVWDAYCEGRKP